MRASTSHPAPRFIGICERVTGKKRPPLRLPHAVMRPISYVTSFVMALLRPNHPQRFTPGVLRILGQQRKADITKAKTELGYRPTSIEGAVREAYDFFEQQGMIGKRLGQDSRVLSSSATP